MSIISPTLLHPKIWALWELYITRIPIPNNTKETRIFWVTHSYLQISSDWHRCNQYFRSKAIFLVENFARHYSNIDLRSSTNPSRARNTRGRISCAHWHFSWSPFWWTVKLVGIEMSPTIISNYFSKLATRTINGSGKIGVIGIELIWSSSNYFPTPTHSSLSVLAQQWVL